MRISSKIIPSTWVICKLTHNLVIRESTHPLGITSLHSEVETNLNISSQEVRGLLERKKKPRSIKKSEGFIVAKTIPLTFAVYNFHRIFHPLARRRAIKRARKMTAFGAASLIRFRGAVINIWREVFIIADAVYEAWRASCALKGQRVNIRLEGGRVAQRCAWQRRRWAEE